MGACQVNLADQPYVIPTKSTFKVLGREFHREITAERNEQGMFRGVEIVDGNVVYSTRWMFKSGGAAKVAMRDVINGKRTECLGLPEQIGVLAGYVTLGLILAGFVYVLIN